MHRTYCNPCCRRAQRTAGVAAESNERRSTPLFTLITMPVCAASPTNMLSKRRSILAHGCCSFSTDQRVCLLLLLRRPVREDDVQFALAEIAPLAAARVESGWRSMDRWGIGIVRRVACSCRWEGGGGSALKHRWREECIDCEETSRRHEVSRDVRSRSRCQKSAFAASDCRCSRQSRDRACSADQVRCAIASSLLRASQQPFAPAQRLESASCNNCNCACFEKGAACSDAEE